MKRETLPEIDFHHVEPNHARIHEELLNWSAWVSVSKPRWISPMFREYRSHAWQWHQPEIKAQVNTLTAMQTEKRVSALPEINRRVIRWAYVTPYGVLRIRRELGVTPERLWEALSNARTMLVNRKLRG